MSSREDQYKAFLARCQEQISALEIEADATRAEYDSRLAEVRSKALKTEDAALEARHRLQARLRYAAT